MTDPPDMKAFSLEEVDAKAYLSQMDFMLSQDKQYDKIKQYARALPYPIESNERMQKMLDFILLR